MTRFDGKNYMDNPKKALVIFAHTHTLLTKDENYRIDTMKGRMNLYCRLLLELVDDQDITKLLEVATEQSENDQRFRSLTAQNVLLPASLREMNYRLKLLWCASVDMLVAAGESQKRQTAALYNDLGIQLTEQPIESFF